MNSILSGPYIEKWRSSDTFKKINERLVKDSVFVTNEIIDKYFGEQIIREFYISKYLFTNKDLVDILNSLKMRSVKEESYEIINEYNKALPVKWDAINERYYIKEGYEEHPVVGISWYGAKLIAELFNGRLPYENEWIVAAKAGNRGQLYPWGNNEPTKDIANYEENVGQTSPVGAYTANELGLYDMAGNVEEWCENTVELENGQESKHEKIVKGGCWYKPADNLLCDSKRTRWAKMSATGIGFRIVWDK